MPMLSNLIIIYAIDIIESYNTIECETSIYPPRKGMIPFGS